MTNVFDAFNFALAQMFRLEQAMPQSGLGATRKEIIMNAVQIAAKVGEGLGVVNPIIPLVSMFIDTTVTTMKKAGGFTRSPAAALPAVSHTVSTVPVVTNATHAVPVAPACVATK